MTTSTSLRPGSGRLPQYLLFAATGVGCALPGVLLPVLISTWHIHDQQAGLAFFFSWMGSSLGALIVRGSLRRCVLLGGALVALGSWGITGLAGGWLLVWMALYGAGMGLTMTSISLIRQRDSDERELVRLNFMWAAGSVACPWLALRALQLNSSSTVLIVFGTCMLAMAFWVAMGVFVRTQPMVVPISNSRMAAFRLIPFSLIVMVCFATGIEASAGAWLATYATRLHHTLRFTVAAPTCLWTGLLLSRLLWSLPGIKASSRQIIQGSLWLVALSTLALVATQNTVGVLLAAFGIGLGLGPVYPLLLARALLYDASGNIFFLAGLGSGSLPWLTGAISQWTSSLRSGLLVPAGAAVVALLLALFVTPSSPYSAASVPPDN